MHEPYRRYMTESLTRATACAKNDARDDAGTKTTASLRCGRIAPSPDEPCRLSVCRLDGVDGSPDLYRRKYGGCDGSVNATVDATANEARVTIRDAGPGFSQDALKRATERFWRDGNARSKRGSGLGLALARAVVERNGGSIVVGNGTNGGGTVTLLFPRADDSPSPR